ncbi:MAG: Ig-like domain-containing protein [Clostridia bacterium]|nr:Ig-like domain-containing protein [Clostridia bacterium]
MKSRKLLSIVLTILMLLAVIPVSALADAAAASVMHRKMWNDTDAIWDRIDAQVKLMDSQGASKKEILEAIYDIAANGEGIISCEWDDENTFHFVHESGMVNGYDWRVNHSDTAIPHDASQDHVLTSMRSLTTATDLDAILLGPYYGQDSSFTNQYRNEVQAVANYTEGNYTIYSGTNVNADACRAIEDYGVVFFDSHGTCLGGKSYLCLTTNNGFTNEDFTSGRAARSGSEALVTGAFWEYYCPNMKASMVWMAICEGMMTNTLAYPLMNAGAACVYGYSQSVTFAGEYMYSATFWNHMKQGENVAESYAAMVSTHGVCDPHGDAYPVVVSEDDAYPSNPDSPQTVNCEWHLPKPSDLVITDAESVYFENDEYGIAPTFSEKLIPVVNPEGANNYTSVWESSDTSVATVDRRGVVKALREGTATITYTITSTENSNTQYTHSASTVVRVSNRYLPEEEMYVATNEMVPGETYLIGYCSGNQAVVMGNVYNDTNNNRTLKSVAVTVGEVSGVKCITSAVDEGMQWEWNSNGYIKNVENGKYLNLTGNYLTMGNTPVVWTFTPTTDAQTGTITNNANSNFKYLGVSNSLTYFSVFLKGYELQLFRKLTREAGELVPGDADGNGVLELADVLMLIRHAMNIEKIPDESLTACDLNNNGTIDMDDALIAMRMVLGSR